MRGWLVVYNHLLYIFVNPGGGVPGFDGRGNPQLDMLFLIVLTCMFTKQLTGFSKGAKVTNWLAIHYPYCFQRI